MKQLALEIENVTSLAPEIIEALEEAKEFVERYMTSERDEKLQIKLDALIKKVKGEFFNKAHQDEDEANARLIAAAPEMLEALEEVKRTCVDDKHRTLESIKAWVLLESAIKKAKGG